MLIINRIKSEPAIVSGVIQALLGLLLAFGVDLSTEQVGAVMAVTAALLALVVRSQVTPLRHLAPSEAPSERGQIDVGTAIVIVVLLLVLLVLLGVIGTR
jgi:uncharacterized membrane protein YphA (DoxX/SURF4 family)